MAIPQKISSLIFLLITSIPFTNPHPQSDSDLIHDLLSLQSTSESGVIRLNDDTIYKFLTSVSTPRPYSLIIFFDVPDLHTNTKLRLLELRREFQILSSSFITNTINKNGTRLFFSLLDATESESSFLTFGIQTLPHVYFVSPLDHDFQDESAQMEGGDYAGLAESMAEFVERQTKLSVGSIHRPPLLSKTQISLIIALIVISSPLIIKLVLIGVPLIYDSRVWLGGAIIVYFFSVAGTMFNIIKQVPLYLVNQVREDDPPKMIFFHQGEMQLGGEGFAVGLLYTVVGLLLGYVTNVLVKVKSVNEQSLFMLLALFISFWCVRQVVHLSYWKTGYEIFLYWPSSWRS